MHYKIPFCILICAFLISTLPAFILLYGPRRFAYATTPSDCCAIKKHENVNITSFDIPTQQKIRLSGWFFPSQEMDSRHFSNVSNSNACILVVHGHGANMARYIRYNSYDSVLEKAVAPLVAAGFNVLTMDLRNHGTSDSASPISLGIHESMDVLAGVEWLINSSTCQRLPDGTYRIGVWGESMGAATVVFATSSGSRAASVKAIVLDSSYASAREVIEPWVNSKISWIPPLLINYWISWFDLLGPFRLDDINVTDRIKEITCPIMIAHGRTDGIVPFSHSKLLYDIVNIRRKSARSNHDFKGHGIEFGCNLDWSLCYFFHDYGHVGAFQTREYHDEMINFFERHV